MAGTAELNANLLTTDSVTSNQTPLAVTTSPKDSVSLRSQQLGNIKWQGSVEGCHGRPTSQG